MNALRLSRPDPAAAPVLSLESVAKPSVIAGHALVKVHAAAIQPSDLVNSRGGFDLTTYPRIPGRDFAGVVVDGPAAQMGQEVYGTSGNSLAFTADGSHAEFSLVPLAALAPKPKTLSFAQAACVGVPFTTAALLLDRAQAKSGETVLVLGASGAVGSALVQLAKARGCRVLCATRRDSGDVNTAKDPQMSAIDTLTNGKGVDILADTTGQPELIQAGIANLAFRGKVTLISAPKSGPKDLVFDMFDFYRKEKSMLGCNTAKYSVQDMAAELRAMTPKFEQGILKGPEESLWTQTPLVEAISAYEKAGQRGAGKFVIVMN